MVRTLLLAKQHHHLMLMCHHSIIHRGIAASTRVPVRRTCNTQMLMTAELMAAIQRTRCAA